MQLLLVPLVCSGQKEENFPSKRSNLLKFLSPAIFIACDASKPVHGFVRKCHKPESDSTSVFLVFTYDKYNIFGPIFGPIHGQHSYRCCADAWFLRYRSFAGRSCQTGVVQRAGWADYSGPFCSAVRVDGSVYFKLRAILARSAGAMVAPDIARVTFTICNLLFYHRDPRNAARRCVGDCIRGTFYCLVVR